MFGGISIDLASERILCVDDNDSKRYCLVHILKKAGFTIEEATTGQAALDRIDAAPPSLIVLDVNLPDISGLEVCRRIRGNPETSSIPILHLSATFTDSESKARGLDAGADVYIAEPYGRTELIATVKALLRAKRAEQAAKKANAQLQHELLERKRLEAELNEKARELEQFTSMVSHDLKEPLRTISNFLALLKRKNADKLDARSIEYLDTAVGGACRLSNLVDSLLDYSRAGYQKLEVRPVDLNTLVSETLTSLASHVQETEAKIEVGPLPLVHGDKTQLFQVFQNLISNAMKFQRRGEIPHIKLFSRPTDDHRVQIVIEDNGIGVPADQSDAIFVAFKRLHTRSEYPGSGIGLSVCKKVIERHGGTISVRSAPHAGTTFSFTLPA